MFHVSLRHIHPRLNLKIFSMNLMWNTVQLKFMWMFDYMHEIHMISSQVCALIAVHPKFTLNIYTIICTWNSRENFYVNFTWINFHVNFMWIFSREFHVNHHSHEIHVIFFTWISRKSLFTWISREFYVKFTWMVHVKFTWIAIHVNFTWGTFGCVYSNYGLNILFFETGLSRDRC